MVIQSQTYSYMQQSDTNLKDKLFLLLFSLKVETTGCCLVLHKLEKLMFASFLMSAQLICNKLFLDFPATSSFNETLICLCCIVQEETIAPTRQTKRDFGA